jgi:hypothetical protein
LGRLNSIIEKEEKKRKWTINTDRSKQSNVRGGHFLAEDPALFDAKFFNLTAEVAAVSLPACLPSLWDGAISGSL